MRLEIIEKLYNILNLYKSKLGEIYFNSYPVITTDTRLEGDIVGLDRIQHTIDDLLVIGAITASPTLLTGSSGSGKSLLAELLCNILFGTDNWIRKNITPDMNEQDFMDIDFGIIKGGGKLKEAIKGDSLLDKPAIIIDEANRAPPLIQNRLMQILENNIDIKSIKINAGIQIEQESPKKYFWNVLTINEGKEYSGTSQMDRAYRDRTIIEIPIDLFPPRVFDQILMIQNDDSRYTLPNSSGVIPDLLEIYKSLSEIGLHLAAEAFIIYLSALSNCEKSNTHSKYGINFDPTFCKNNDCTHARGGPIADLCPNIYAPSIRVLRKLKHVARGFALLRATLVYKKIKESPNYNDALEDFLINEESGYITNLEVTDLDIKNAAPFVLRSKMNLNPHWIIQKYQGNKFYAISDICNIIFNRITYYYKKIYPIIKKLPFLPTKQDSFEQLKSVIENPSLSVKEKTLLQRALKDDHFFEAMIFWTKCVLG